MAETNQARGTSASSDQVERFCTLVLADAALQERLRATDEPDAFIALVIATAGAYGFNLDADSVRSAMRGRLPHLQHLPGTRVTETTLPPHGWLPVGTAWQHDELYVDWSYFGDQPLRQPFFEGDVQLAMRKPFNRLLRYCTPICKLGGWLADHPPLQPSGFIFHLSRCGSTLVSQMLAADPCNIAISEAAAIDAVVQANFVRPELSLEQQAQWLRALVGAFGQPRAGIERHYFIKLDSWHTLALPLFRLAFPGVPWVFLYRDPVEVMVSQALMPGIQMIPGALGPDVFGLGLGLVDGIYNREQHCARVLARICEPVLRAGADDKALLVNYAALPDALWTAILPHFGVPCSADDRAVMAGVARFDAKTPSFEFTRDVEAKQQEASSAVRAAADERLGALYRALEQLRAAG